MKAWDVNIDFAFAFDFHAIITYITGRSGKKKFYHCFCCQIITPSQSQA